MEVIEADVCGWPGLRVSSGSLSCGLVPAVGGRILSLEFEGEELLYSQKGGARKVHDFSGVEDLSVAKRELGFGLWGGDKTWVAPQQLWTEGIPPLELDAGAYECSVEGEAIRMSSVACRETGLRIHRRVSFSGEGFLLEEEFENVSGEGVRRGIWNVTQFLRPFLVCLPVPRDELRPYEEEGDSKSFYASLSSPAEGWVAVPCDAPVQFKFGGRAASGLMIAVRRSRADTLVHVRRFETDPGASYAHDASVEVYNSPDHDYLEMESHAPLETLPPGGSLSRTQRWEFFRAAPEISFSGILESVSA